MQAGRPLRPRGAWPCTDPGSTRAVAAYYGAFYAFEPCQLRALTPRAISDVTDVPAPTLAAKRRVAPASRDKLSVKRPCHLPLQSL
jgi:hypothetical protein